MDIQVSVIRQSEFFAISSTFSEMIEKDPENTILKAVKGMLPKNKLSNSMISKLKIYAGDNHPHAGQNPIKIEL